MVFKFVKTNTFIKVNFLLIKNMDMAMFSFLVSKITKFIMVNGSMVLWMVMEKNL